MDDSVPRRPSLAGRHFEVVIIGGGISGAAVARACAQGGLRALLLEQHDFGSGTSSRSTRIIHGGLRYLEQGELGLVRHSLRERARLEVEKPHLVRPLRFLLAFPENTPMLSLRTPLAIRFGLWLYRRMGGRPRHPEAKPSWPDSARWRLYDYEDAQCEFPERLIAEWLTEAVDAGAVARNHSSVLEVTRHAGRVTGVIARDRITGEEFRVTCGAVINAAGPWVDQVAHASGLTGSAMVGGVRGSHIVLPCFPGMPQAAVYTEAVDGRPFFVLPWNGHVLVGTTEVADRGAPENAHASAAEADYLFRSFGRIFPSSGLRRHDIAYAFAGVRPLPRTDGEDPHAITRRYILHDHADDGLAGMTSIIGGKLTTAAALGRHCARMLGARVPEPATVVVATGPDSGFAVAVDQWSKLVSNGTRNCRGVVSMESARALADWHGRSALCIVRRSSQQSLLAQPIVDHSPHIVGEALQAVEREQAITLADILLRRVPIALDPRWDHACSLQAGSRIARALGWDGRRLGRELEAFAAERAAFLQAPSALTDEGGPPARSQNIA